MLEEIPLFQRSPVKDQARPEGLRGQPQCKEGTSKGSYRSWKKIVKVWMMMMMKEGILAGHPSLALPLPLPCLDCPCLTCPCPQTARHPPPPHTLAQLTLAS